MPTSPDVDENGEEISYEEHKTNTLSVALFKNGKVVGHLTTRVSFELPVASGKSLPVPLSMIVGDGLHEVAYGMQTKQLVRLREREIGEIETRLTKILNERRTPLQVRNLRMENTSLLTK